MNEAVTGLLSRLRESMGFALPPPQTGRPGEAPSVEYCLTVLSEALQAISMVGLALLWRKNNDQRALADASVEALSDPSLENHVRFQSLLFPTHRDAFAQVFPVQYMGKDLLPLYLRKYLQVLEELDQIAKMPTQDRKGKDLEQSLEYALTFLVNNWVGSLAVLRPSARAPEGPTVHVMWGPAPTAKIRSRSNQIAPGLYLLSDTAQPLALHPFYYLENDEAYVFRMLTSDGAFYRHLGKEGFSLLFKPPLLMDLGDFLFRAGAYDRAIRLYRLMEQENRDAAILVSALNHCLNARELSSRGEQARACAEWELALAVRPDVPVLYHEASRDYLDHNRHAQAVGVLNRLLERFPLSDEGYVALGDVYTAKGDFGRAQRAYEKALLLNPHHAKAPERKQSAQDRLAAKPQAETEKQETSEDLLFNFTQRVRLKPHLPLVGRENALGQLLEILACKEKRSAILVGDPGVGKTALVEELALSLQDRPVPESLKGKPISALNVGALISGARFRGQFEERALEVLRRVRERGHLLLVENMHQMVATGGSKGGSLDLASLMAPALVAGEIQVIGTTDEESFAAILEKDPSFLKHFHLLRLEELSIEHVQEVVVQRTPVYEDFHGVHFPEGLVEKSLELIRLSIGGRALPESALDLMDRAASRAARAAAAGQRPDRTVTRRDLLETLSEMSGVAYERLSLLDNDRLAQMEEWLSRRVVDQEDAVARLSRLVRAAKLGLDLNSQRPDGVFLFVGPTGVGKTELARCLAERLFGDREKLIRIDMSEYMERISTSRLIGTAPGYVGYYDQNQLTDQVRKNPYCVVLFDEVEKADPQVLNLFLQVFDAGRLTDGKGRTVRFHHATIIMTSNVGTHLYSKGRMGYGEGTSGPVEEEAVLREVRTQFTPEFLNRVDEVILFKSLSPESLCRIVNLQLEDLTARLGHQGKALLLDPEARDFLAREGYSFEYGARNLGRILRRRILEPMADLALTSEWDRSTAVRVRLDGGAIAVDLLFDSGGVIVETAGQEHESESERDG